MLLFPKAKRYRPGAGASAAFNGAGAAGFFAVSALQAAPCQAYAPVPDARVILAKGLSTSDKLMVGHMLNKYYKYKGPRAPGTWILMQLKITEKGAPVYPAAVTEGDFLDNAQGVALHNSAFGAILRARYWGLFERLVWRGHEARETIWLRVTPERITGQ